MTAFAAQLVYILVNWYYFRRKEYVFYSLYILTVSAYFLNKYAADNNGFIHVAGFSYYELYPDKILAIISYFFYFKFGRHFVEASTRYPVMNRLMKKAEVFLLTYVITNAILLAFTGDFKLEGYIFLPVNVGIFIVLIYVFWTMIRRNETLDRFILTGSMAYAICAFITMWLGQNKGMLEDEHIIVLQIGAIIELILLNAGLVYKSRMLQNQTIYAQQELIGKYEENQQLMQRLGNIREKITRDLHDDVGATLSSVKAYSEILLDKPGNAIIAGLIKDNSLEMIEKLEGIAWATNPQFDYLKNIKARMQKFAAPLCHTHNIQWSILSNGLPDNMQIPGEIRQNLFLVFKEALNNTIKYADATECNTIFFIEGSEFTLSISDNGKGCDGTIKGSGNGWENMKRRADELNGNIAIETELQKGTKVIMRLPYPFKIPSLWDKEQPSQ